MGIYLFSSNYTDKNNTNFVPPNPNPFKSKIISYLCVNKVPIVEVQYEGCTTFNGHKLLVLKKETTMENIDPHLLGNDHIVLARFEPNILGWRLARICAEEYSKLTSHI